MYINTTTLTQHSETELRALFPNTSFPQPFLPPEGYALVFPAPQPAHDAVTQRVQEIAPELTTLGHWEQRWEVMPKFTTYTDDGVTHTAAEQEAAAVAADQAARVQALQAAIVNATQQRLDDFAKTRNYDSILSACTYASSAIPKFASEGQYAVNARDSTWATLSTLLGEVQAGTRPMPTGFADVSPLLPVLTWP